MKKRSRKGKADQARRAAQARAQPVMRDAPGSGQGGVTRELGASSLQPGIGVSERELGPVLEGAGGLNLARAKTHWFFGEWGALAQLDLDALGSHPDRDRFALLVASAHQQLGNHGEARELTRLALEWGCPQRLVAQVLIAGVHNSLGRASALREDGARTERHFRAAVAVTDSTDVGLATHARSVRELARLGLLPEAVSFLGREIQAVGQRESRPREQRARLDVLESQVDLLRGSLLLAQERLQPLGLPDVPAVAAASSPDPAGLRQRAVSQLGQELWVLERTGFKRGGFFVEFGATDGVTLSNTWLLEREFGWSGICAEPNPRFLPLLRSHRRCTVSDACIGARTGELVEFVLADEYSGMTRHARLDGHAAKRAAYLELPGSTISLRTISLDDFLRQMGAPRHIDYLSIDTEGSELEILAAFPFSEWDIDLITVEHNFTPQREQIRELLESRGYAYVEAQWDDWFYRRDAE